jgi:predicted NBD/HSP70 family sugar kinase
MEVSTVVQAVADTAEKLLTDRMGLRFSRDRVALGLQLASPVDTKSGTVHYFCKVVSHHPRFTWEDVPLGSRLRQAINLETIVDNDANAFAVKEQWFGVGQEADDFAVMLIREGLGGSLVRDGRLFSGPVEVGHFICSAGGLRESDAGQWGALECSGGTAAILADIGERTGQVIDDVEAAAALAEEDSLENPAVAAFRAAGNATALGISYLVNIAGPSHVALYGPAVMLEKGRGAASFLEQVKQFRGRVAYKRFRDCELILRPLGRYDGAHGAALMALQQCFAVAPKAKLSEIEPTR